MQARDWIDAKNPVKSGRAVDEGGGKRRRVILVGRQADSAAKGGKSLATKTPGMEEVLKSGSPRW